MQRRTLKGLAVICLVPLWIAFGAFTQLPAQDSPRQAQASVPAEKIAPPLFFQTEWKQSEATEARPVTSADLTNPNLELRQYGPDTKIKDPKVEHGVSLSPKKDRHIQTLLCTTPCGLALRDKSNYVDLTGLAKIRWHVWEYGFHLLHPIVKLADGTWLVGDHADGMTTDYRDSEFLLADVRWRRLDIDRLVELPAGQWIDHPDLSKVDEIGFVDLMPGSGHGYGGASYMTRMEVYGKSAPRNSSQSKR